MDFRLLGRLEVWDGSRPVVLGGPKQKAVLAVLLLNHGDVVSADALIDDVWGEHAPGGAGKTLQVYVWQLRRALEPGRLPGSPPHVLVTRSPGYALRIDDSEVDVERFEDLARSGRAALDDGEADRALGLLDDGLALWRGAALADFTYEPFAAPAIARLEELRLTATEDRIDAELALGGHHHAVAELEALVTRHPLRERLRRQLALAMYRGDRQADALAACRDARRMLADELGIDPGPPLQDLERAILNQDPGLAPPVPPTKHRRRATLGGTVRLSDAVGRRESGVLSFLIADIRGYTAFTQAHGDQAAAELASRFARIAREGVEAHGGDVPELRGDEALAVFPSPRHALRAAAELQQTFADECELRPDLPLRVGIGIDVGEAVGVDGGYRGGPLNLAARLCAQAAAGEIIVSQSLMLLVRSEPDVPFEGLGEVELKGIAERVSVFRAGSAPAEPASGPAAVPSEVPAPLIPHTPAVGRDRDARRMGWAWRRMRRGGRGAVLVTGSAGMGKTRLLAEGALLAADDGARIDYVDFRRPGASLPTGPPAEASVPWYLAADNLEQASIDDVDAIERIVHRGSPPALVALAMDTERAGADVVRAAHRLVDDYAVIRLGALDLDDMRRIGELYVGSQAERIPAGLLEATGGTPLHVHEAVADWARSEASERLGGYAADTASGRSGLRAAEAGLAGSIVDLQVVRERALAFAPRTGGDEAPPYRGLARFDVGDSEWFFGRERLVADMVSRLAGASLLGVVGPSGSGKSSAVRAGLVATITSGILPDGEDRIVALMRPGEHALRSLDRAVWAALPEPLRDRVGEDDRPLSGLASALRGRGRLVLIVDQFEELFTMCTREEEPARFVDAITDAVTETADVLTVVIAVRADFYGRCADYPELAALLGANHVLVGAMSADEYRQAIEQPAARSGTRIEPPVVDALVSQVLGEPGALPLLSTALLELWQTRRGSAITVRALDATGGVQGAVARLAEGAYAELDDEHKELARRLFVRLAGPGEGRSIVKRRVPLSELGAGHDQQVADLVERMAQHRLITLDESSVEIVHEALLREWPRYQAWLEEDQQGRLVQAHLAAAAREWEERNHDPGELYRGARMSAAGDWAAHHDADLNTVERAFLAASRARHQAEMRRLRALLAGAVALLAVAAVAAAIALVQRGSARRAATSADAQRLGAEAVVAPPLDRALLLAREAVNLRSEAATQTDLWTTLLRSPAAVYIYHPPPFSGVLSLSPDGKTLAVGSDAGAVTFYDTGTHRRLRSVTPRGFGSSRSVGALAFSHDGRTLAVGEGGGSTIDLLDAASGRSIGGPIAVPHSIGIARLAFSPDDRTLAIGYGNQANAYTVSRIDVPTSQAVPPAVDVSGGDPVFDGIDKLIYAPDGDLIASDWGAGKIVVLAAKTLAVRRTYRIPHVTSIALSKGGTSLAVGRDDGTVSLMPLATGRPRLVGRHAPLGGIWSAEFTPDGRSLVTTSADHTATVWDVRSGTPIDALTGQSDIVTQQAISPDGETVYTGSADGTVVAWDIGGRNRLGRTLPFTPAYPADIYSDPQPTAAAVSPDGKLLALSGQTGLIQLWSLRSLRPVGPPFRGFSERDTTSSDGAEDLAFSPDGRLLAAGGGAGSTIVVWNVATHQIVHRLTPPSKPEPHGDGLQFSPDGRTLANGDGGYGTLLWNLDTEHATRLLDGRKTYVASLAYGLHGTRLATVDFAFPVNHGVLWDLTRHPARRIAVFPAGHARGLGVSVAFSPNGRLLATGNYDGTVTLRDARTGRVVRTFAIPNGYNGTLAYSPDGKRIAALAHDGAEVWDVATGTQIGAALPGASPQAGNPGGPGNLRFTRDGQLVIVSPNGLATIWNVDPATWDAAACRIAGRELSRAEWARFVPGQPYSAVCP